MLNATDAPRVTAPPAAPRRKPLSPAEKMKELLDTMQKLNWTLADFFFHLFKLEEMKPGPISEMRAVVRSEQHSKMLDALLSGKSKPCFGIIIELVYKNACRVAYRKNDLTQTDSVFPSGRHPGDIEHARPAMTIWAVHHVAELVQAEAQAMINPDSHFHVRISSRPDEHRRRKVAGEKVSWELIDSFSLAKVKATAVNTAPVMWHILSVYANPNYENLNKAVIRRHRPQDVACVGAIASLTFCRSNRANLYALCRGIWYFAVKAHHSIFRVESRLAQSVAYESVYTALRSMALATRNDLREAVKPHSGRFFIIVSDNIQAYSKQRDHRIGRENKMIKGLAGTAIEMQDVDPAGFDMKELVRRQGLQERKNLTAEMILDDIDWSHLQRVASIQFLKALVDFVPALASYQSNLKDLYKTIEISAIPPTRRSKITPLATNSTDEMHVQELKQGILDFLSTQMGVDEKSYDGRSWVLSGDGKTFDQLLRMRKFLTVEDSDFESFRWLVPLLELWHTKWTDLSRVTRTHWGKGSTSDPSSLGCLANLAECPTPSDLRKVDFYSGAHIVNLALDAHLLNCWELHFGSHDLVSYFAEKKENGTLPEFTELVAIANRLGLRHATTNAYKEARNPGKGDWAGEEVPLGTPWAAPAAPAPETTDRDTAGSSAKQAEDDSGEDSDIDGLSDLSGAQPTPEADITLANATLLIRDSIWWREMCSAISTGDTGRVWEILKIWIFTFSGSGNPYYSLYLLELYCNFKWEFPPALRENILKNWLVNIRGEAEEFSEMDLLQEHFNFWLEDMAQHKGKEFDEPFYRFVLSMNVHHFLRLKDEMEEAVSLKPRTKRHSEPHLNNELNRLRDYLWDNKVNTRRLGRSQGHEAIDDFERGLQLLKHEKIKRFIDRSTSYMDIQSMRMDFDDDEWFNVGRDELPAERDQPPPRMIGRNGNLFLANLVSNNGEDDET